jgi:hypothetical protein
MSQSEMSDCSDSIYSFNASSDPEDFSFELSGKRKSFFFVNNTLNRENIT